MNALLLAVLVNAAPAPTGVAVHVGGQVGFPWLLGVTSRGTFLVEGRPRFDVDIAWEPSVQLQSYSVGGAYHVLDRAFFVGGRLRAVQYQPPWARGPVELFFGMGLELGARIPVGAEDQGAVTIALHGTFVPGQARNLNTLIGLSAGFSWSIFSR